MSTAAVIVIIVVVVVVVVVAFALWSVFRRRRLQQRFGSEYDRAVADQPNRGAAEHELRARERRYAALEITPLSDADQQRYLREWERVQAGFVDEPRVAVNEADALVTQVMVARGYPTGGFDQRVETLSVDNARTVENYRDAHEIAQANIDGQASTEQLRQALVHYRTLATSLLDIDDAPNADRVDDRANDRDPSRHRS
jgi:hypothetical protein